MLLVIDIGNTNICIGIFKNDCLIKVWRIASDNKKTADEYGILISLLLDKNKISNAVISSVVPVLEQTVKNAVIEYLKITPFVVSYKSKLPVNILLKEPKEAGADRLANASAACTLYRLPAIVIDIGTATTFDVIDKNKNFIGGIIAPGPLIQAKSLNSFTSKLPQLKIETPKNFIGKNTVEAMLSGIVFGHAKMVEAMIEKCEEELGGKALIIGTGGFSDTLFTAMKRPFDLINKNLTLEGLRIIHKLNTGDIL